MASSSGAKRHFGVIVGSSRGIGLELARAYLRRTDLHLVSLSRTPDVARSAILDGAHDPAMADRLTNLGVDITDEQSLAAAAKSVKEQLGNNLRLLLNVAGVLRVEKGLSQIKYEDMLETFRVNTFAPLLSFKHFVPLVPKSFSAPDAPQAEDASKGLLPANSAVLASLSAKVGSIGDNERGGWYSYRASKAALNQVTRTVSRELLLRKVPAIALSLHPGTVRSELSRAFTGGPGGNGKPKKPGEFEADEAAANLVEVMRGVTEEHNGAFLNYAAERLPY